MAKRTTLRGSLALTGLKHETIVRNGEKGIFIPVEKNPSIFFKVKEDGTKVVNLDIEVTPTPDNKYGNSHFIRLSVGKENRTKYNIQKEKLREVTPIVGNLKTFEYDDKGEAQGDMPDFGGPAPQEINDAW